MENGKNSTPSFRAKLEPVGKNSKCRFLKDHYEIIKQIGEGTYGQVYTAIHNETGEEVALKKIRMDNEKDGFPITAVREIKILKSANHDNVIRLREIIRSSPERGAPVGAKCGVYMVFDFMDHDLTGYFEQMKFRMPLPQVKFFVLQLLRGLNACHRNGILHRDLKLSNLLISRHGDLKIADFGLARPYQQFPDSKMTNRVITLWYRPPELLLGTDKYGIGVDMWSVGCILAELLVGKALFPGKDEIDQLDKIFTMTGAPNERTMPGCSKLSGFSRIPTEKYSTPKLRDWFERHQIDTRARDLLQKLLDLDPKKRPSTDDALIHPFFRSEPRPGRPENLKNMPPSHEYTLKRNRTEQSQAHGGAQHQEYKDWNSKRYPSNSFDQQRKQQRWVKVRIEIVSWNHDCFMIEINRNRNVNVNRIRRLMNPLRFSDAIRSSSNFAKPIWCAENGRISRRLIPSIFVGVVTGLLIESRSEARIPTEALSTLDRVPKMPSPEDLIGSRKPGLQTPPPAPLDVKSAVIKITDWTKEAERFSEASNFIEALKLYDKIVKSFPDLAITEYARLHRAFCYYELDDVNRCLLELNDLEVSLRGYPEVHASLAVVLYSERPSQRSRSEEQWDLAMEFDQRYSDPNWVHDQKKWGPKLMKALNQFLALG
eukprot:g5548.t1